MNHFGESLAMSHAAEDLPLWREVYEAAFPQIVAMPNHRADGQHQRQGIDRSVVLSNGKTLWIDEKVRGRNRKTGKVYEDIALEYLSDAKRGDPGWVCKPLMADYIAYAIAPLGRCYLLPVPQLQEAWRQNGEQWLEKYGHIHAPNQWNGREWQTLSCCVPPRVLFVAIGSCLRVRFAPMEVDQ